MHTLVDVLVESNDPSQVLQNAVSVIEIKDSVNHLREHSIRLHPDHPSSGWDPSHRRTLLGRTFLAAASSATASCTAGRQSRPTDGTITAPSFRCVLR